MVGSDAFAAGFTYALGERRVHVTESAVGLNQQARTSMLGSLLSMAGFGLNWQSLILEAV